MGIGVFLSLKYYNVSSRMAMYNSKIKHTKIMHIITYQLQCASGSSVQKIIIHQKLSHKILVIFVLMYVLILSGRGGGGFVFEKIP